MQLSFCDANSLDEREKAPHQFLLEKMEQLVGGG